MATRTWVKGQIKPKADWCAVDSPIKRTNDFFFAFLLFTAIKTNSFVRFLGESTAHKSAFGSIWPLSVMKMWSDLPFSKKTRKLLPCNHDSLVISFSNQEFSFQNTKLILCGNIYIIMFASFINLMPNAQQNSYKAGLF